MIIETIILALLTGISLISIKKTFDKLPELKAKREAKEIAENAGINYEELNNQAEKLEKEERTEFQEARVIEPIKEVMPELEKSEPITAKIEEKIESVEPKKESVSKDKIKKFYETAIKTITLVKNSLEGLLSYLCNNDDKAFNKKIKKISEIKTEVVYLKKIILLAEKLNKENLEGLNELTKTLEQISLIEKKNKIIKLIKIRVKQIGILTSIIKDFYALRSKINIILKRLEAIKKAELKIEVTNNESITIEKDKLKINYLKYKEEKAFDSKELQTNEFDSKLIILIIKYLLKDLVEIKTSDAIKLWSEPDYYKKIIKKHKIGKTLDEFKNNILKFEEEDFELINTPEDIYEFNKFNNDNIDLSLLFIARMLRVFKGDKEKIKEKFKGIINNSYILIKIFDDEKNCDEVINVLDDIKDYIVCYEEEINGETKYKLYLNLNKLVAYYQEGIKAGVAGSESTILRIPRLTGKESQIIEEVNKLMKKVTTLRVAMFLPNIGTYYMVLAINNK